MGNFKYLKLLTLKGYKRKILKNLSFVTSCWVIPQLSMAETKSVSYENHTSFAENRDQDGSQERSNNWIGLSLNLDPVKEDFDYYGEADIRLIFNEDGDQSFSFPEFYVTKKYQFKDFFFDSTVGRKKINWNPFENFWQQNDFNPRQNFTLLGEKQEGLVGFFNNVSFRNIKLNTFLSFLYLPELEPQIKIDSGQFSSNANWAALPPEFAQVGSVRYPIRYMLNRPSASSVIQNKSLGGEVELDLTDGLRLRTHAIYKPENFIRPNANAGLETEVPTADDMFIRVDIDPIINHHAIYGGSLEVDFSNRVSMGLGYEHINPLANLGDVLITDRAFESDNLTIKPDYSKREFFYASLNYAKKYLNLGVNYIKRTKGQTPNDDLSYNAADKWQNAFGFRADYSYSDKDSFIFDIKYDIERNDNVLKTEYSRSFLKNLRLALGLELVDTDSEDSYWSDYVNQDVAYSSLRYFF